MIEKDLSICLSHNIYIYICMYMFIDNISVESLTFSFEFRFLGVDLPLLINSFNKFFFEYLVNLFLS